MAAPPEDGGSTAPPPGDPTREDPRPGPTAGPTAFPTGAPTPARDLRLGAWALGAVLLLAAVLRVAFALHKGLVLDEFHSWFHATRPDPASLLASVRQDNHPPLSFALIGAARALLGSSELALRTPALLAGLLEIALVARIARRLGCRPPVAAAAAALLSVSSLHLDFSTQARMYALLSLCVTAALDATLALLLPASGDDADRQAEPGSAASPSRGARVQLGLAIAAGLHVHYYFGQDLLWIGAAVLTLAVLRPELRPHLRALVLPVLVGGALALPWYATGFRAQLAHGLPPGGDEVRLADLGEAYVHLFFLNLRLGGPLLRVAFALGGAGLVLGGLAGGLRLVLARDVRRAAGGWLLGAVAFGVPVGAWALARLLPRAGFTWHYVLPSAAALAVLAVAGVALPDRDRGGARRGLGHLWALAPPALVACGLLAATLSVLNAASVGSEDHRGAVRELLARHRPGDLVVCAEFQPPVFPQGQPYDYYAPRWSADPPPRAAMVDVNLADPGVLRDAPRVLLLGSALQPGHRLLQDLHARFGRVTLVPFGHRPHLYVFEDPR